MYTKSEIPTKGVHDVNYIEALLFSAPTVFLASDHSQYYILILQRFSTTMFFTYTELKGSVCVWVAMVSSAYMCESSLMLIYDTVNAGSCLFLKFVGHCKHVLVYSKQSISNY